MQEHKLDETAKFFVIKLLACGDGPQKVADAVKEKFDIVISRQNVEHYDPRKNEKLESDFQEFFWSERQKFLSEVDAVPIHHLAVRQHLRQSILDSGERNPVLIKMKLEVLREAAKDSGGLYTNRRELTGKNGEPLLNATPGNVGAMPTSELREVFAGLVTKLGGYKAGETKASETTRATARKPAKRASKSNGAKSNGSNPKTTKATPAKTNSAGGQSESIRGQQRQKGGS